MPLVPNQGKAIPSSSQPFIVQTPTLMPNVTAGVLHKYSASTSAGYSGRLQPSKW